MEGKDSHYSLNQKGFLGRGARVKEMRNMNMNNYLSVPLLMHLQP